MSWHWVHIEAVHLFWGVGAVMAVWIWREFSSGDRLASLVSRTMQRRLAHRVSAERRAFKLVFAGLSLAAAVLAIMRPQTEGVVEGVQGTARADIVFALDVSRSMLAEDAAPYRLARAKAEVSALLDELSGHRVSLVVFAGKATVLCPLTPDYGFFRLILRGADTTSMSRGGTNLAEAIDTAVGAFGEDSVAGAKLVVLITDGEDHDGTALDAAKRAAEAGVRIVTVGFGSEQGSSITLVDPDTGARKKLRDRDGNVVTSRLDGKALRDIALETEGAYVPAGTSALDLESIVEAHLEPLVRKDTVSVRRVPGELYPWFVLGSLLCLIVAVWFGSSAPRRQGLLGGNDD